MNRDAENYDQPEKKQARWLALCHAVESLTSYRQSSPVVTLDHFRRGMNYACDSIEKANKAGYTCFPVPHEQVKEKLQTFEELHTSRVGKKQAGDLQVLFLCGPEPMNDLEVMLELGIRPENVWAVESDKEVFKKAVESLFVSGYGIKIYRGSLQQFFEIVPQQFDIVNAVAHRDYTSNASVQVMLFADRLEVWNPGELPPPLTPESLRAPHASIPRNPLIADPMFLARYAEKAGSGILDMIARCKKAGLPTPEFRQEGGQFIQKLSRPNPAVTPQVTPQVDSGRNLLKEQSLQELASALGLTIAQVTPQVTARVEKVLGATANEARSREELQTATGMMDREHFRKAYVEPLVTAGWLERSIPDKPTSRLQKYRLTAKGRDWLVGAMK